MGQESEKGSCFFCLIRLDVEKDFSNIETDEEI